MEKYLHEISRVLLHDCTKQSYIIKCIASKSLYICYPFNYPKLSSYLASSVGTFHENKCLTLGLTYSLTHSLIFDIDVCGSNISREKHLNFFYSVFLDVLKFHLASVLKDFTVILTMREDYSGGMHVHLPEIEISHDDYIFLCNQMKSKCNKRDFEVTFKLDCPSSMSLVGSGKPGNARYIPVEIILVDVVNDKTDCIAVYKQDYFSELSQMNVKNERSCFKRLISIDKKKLFDEELLELMMPCVSSMKPLYRVFFASHIYPDKPHQQHVVAKFTHILNKRQYVICKEDNIEIMNDEKDWLKCFHYLKRNAHAITAFKSINNRVLKTWCKRFSSDNFNDTGIFKKFNTILRSYDSYLKEQTNPLEILLSYDSQFKNSGYFFVPVFNALCSILRNRYSPEIIAERLDTFLPFEHDSKKFMELGNLSHKTIIYCSLKMKKWESHDSNICPIKRHMNTILSKFEDFLRYVTTTSEIEDFIRWIQEHFFPIIKSVDSENVYCWNPFKERWQVIPAPQKEKVMHTILNHIIWYEMKCIMCQHSWFNLFSQVSISRVLDDVLKELKNAKPIRLTKIANIPWTNVPEFYILDQEQQSYWNFLEKKCDYF